MQARQPFPQPDHTQLDYPPPSDHTQLDYPPPAGYPPPPPSESRLPYPPPNVPQGPPPGGQSPYYGAPVEPDMSDTQRMLQPKGLLRGAPQFGEYQFSEHGEFGPPPPWPGAPGAPAGGPGAPGEYGPGPGDYGMMPPGMGGYPGGPMQRPRRSYRGLIIGSALAIVVIVGLVLVVQSMRGGGGSPTAGGTTPAGTSSSSGGGTPTASASAAAASQQAEKAAATRLAALLPQSGKDRTAVIDAVVNVEACKSLPSAAAAFTASADNRQNLLSKLGTLQGRSALPGALVSSLTTAWQASVEADNDLAKWANAATHGCKKGPPKGPIYSASLGPDNQATIGKTDFVRQWNPIAGKFGLQSYSVSQL